MSGLADTFPITSDALRRLRFNIRAAVCDVIMLWGLKLCPDGSCPWGPAAGGVIFMLLLAAVTLFIIPPILWLMKVAVAPWWAFWLG
jgi:hypothetical protein